MRASGWPAASWPTASTASPPWPRATTSLTTDGSPPPRSRAAPRSSAPGWRAPSIDPERLRRSNTSVVRIAIIGTGISGLTAAHLLHPEHEIVVYEAGDHVGGHANTVRVDTEDATWQVDTGFIVLNDRNYPRFRSEE